jgi:hypothetical protein
MDARFWQGFAAYLLPTFPLGYLWHLVWFHEAYGRLGVYREDVVIPMGLGSMIVQAAAFSWAFPRLFVDARRTWWVNGAVGAAAFALLAWSYAVLPVAAKHVMTSVPGFFQIETAFTVAQYAIYAPLIGWVHRPR